MLSFSASRFAKPGLFIFALTTLSLVAAVGCGKEGNKDSGKQEKSKTEITQAGVSEDGKLFAAYSSSNGLNDFRCRIKTSQATGEWFACKEGMLSYPYPAGEKFVTLEIKNGEDGEVSSQIIEAVPSPSDVIGTDTAPEEIPAVQNTEFFDPSTNGMALSGTQLVYIPDGFRLLRYSNSTGVGANAIETIMMIPEDNSIASDLVPPTLCESVGNPAAPYANFRPTFIMNGIGAPNSQPANYCRALISPQLLKAHTELQLSLDSVEMISDNTRPFEMIAASVYQSNHDAGTTVNRFSKLCGDNAVIETSNPHPLPAASDFFSGTVRFSVAESCYTVRKIGNQMRKFFVGYFILPSFHGNAVGPGGRPTLRVESLEYLVISAANDRSSDEFKRDFSRSALMTIQPTKPLYSTPGAPNYQFRRQ